MKDVAQRELILEAAFAKFRRLGLRRVTLAELASELRISKKTLYQHFESKEALVREVLETHVIARVLPVIAQAAQSDAPLATRLTGIWRGFSQIPRLVTPELLADLRGDYPHIWQEIHERRKLVLEGMEALLEEGLRTGEVRPEINAAATVRILLAVAENVMVPDVLAHAPFTPAEAVDTLMTLLLRGAFVHPDEPAAES